MGRVIGWSVLGRILVSLAVAFGMGGTAWGQADFLTPVEIPSSFNPVGSGARALGMGGAFIGVADDATAASWNPGGLIQLERPEVSAVGDYVHRIEDLSFAADPGADGAQTIDRTSLNYMSAAYPFFLAGRNMIVSLNYQHLFDFTRQWSFPLRQSGPNLTLDQNVEHRQEGRLSALGLAYAIQVTPRFSLGMTVNVWDDDLTENSWDVSTWQWGGGEEGGDRFAFSTRSLEKFEFSGWNVNLGAMWNVTGQLTLGFVLKTPFDADVRHRVERASALEFLDLPGFGTADENVFVEDATISMPLSVGVGAAWRFSDEFSMSLDVYRTEWDDFEFEDGEGRKTNPVTGTEEESDPTHQVRMGAEYLFIFPEYVIPARAGLFYDPAPAAGAPDDFYGLTLGTGLSMARFSLDFAYQYRAGNNVGEYQRQAVGFSEDVREHSVFGSVIVYF
jgi:long-subunit fatty acid transport protein